MQYPAKTRNCFTSFAFVEEGIFLTLSNFLVLVLNVPGPEHGPSEHCTPTPRVSSQLLLIYQTEFTNTTIKLNQGETLLVTTPAFQIFQVFVLPMLLVLNPGCIAFRR